jgi:hypothetical protein
MKGYPPTCPQCGSVLSGLATSDELGAFVYLCPQCSGAGAVAPVRAAALPTPDDPTIEEMVLPEAA